MPRKILFKTLVTSLFLLATFVINKPTFGATLAVEYLCELGISFYNLGKYADALTEFNKALMVEPDNQTAKRYINDIFKNTRPPQEPQKPEKKLSREKLIDQTLNKLSEKEEAPEKPKIKPLIKETAKPKKDGFKISGETQLSVGITPQDTVWKRANFDLNEKFKSWRPVSEAGFNRRFNTYDPRIYDSLHLNVDMENKQGFNLHTNVTVDPWSFVGKSNKILVTGSNNDTAEVQMYYWSNTGYVVNKTVYTSLQGDTIDIPEVKVKNGKTDPFTVTSNFSSANFNIPSLKINREFQPLRELWLDYDSDEIKFRVFPIGYQDQAYSSDDPLGITNHSIWWKDSKWLRRYTPGISNPDDSGGASFTKGRWDDSLSFLTKDSIGAYLTGLRGFSLSFQPQEETSFDTTIATPRHLWQDYSEVDNVISTNRLKHYFSDNFMVGGIFTSRLGFITDPKQKLDSQNYVGGVDLGYEISDGVKAQAEILASQSFYDMNNHTYEADSRGNVYYFSLIGRYPQKSIMDLEYGYDEIAMNKEEDLLMKAKFYAVHMDEGFDSALADFHNTRQDVPWSRHIHFREPLKYYFAGLYYPTLKWEDIEVFRIGDGIDIGRDTLGFRFEAFLEDKFSNLFDVHNVHNVEGKFVENVARDEATVKVTDKLTAKGLGIYHKLPKTLGGTDPFVYDGKTGDFFTNDAVADGKNPTIKTGSFGLNYDFFDGLSLNGIYERTNDYTLAYGDFPRNVLRNDTTLNWVSFENNKRYLSILPSLSNQGVFPQAPYEFYNVFKFGLRIAPLDKMEIYLDYTRNEFEAASLINDNMNHIGLELTYMPTKKLGMAFKYAYSRSKDIIRLSGTNYGLTTQPVGHHNLSSEFRYLPSEDDEFILQYGDSGRSPIAIISLDPYGGSLSTLDTQHIVRLYYRRKF